MGVQRNGETNNQREYGPSVELYMEEMFPTDIRKYQRFRGL